jgi:DNA-binding transcriptional LysR family regulator
VKEGFLFWQRPPISRKHRRTISAPRTIAITWLIRNLSKSRKHHPGTGGQVDIRAKLMTFKMTRFDAAIRFGTRDVERFKIAANKHDGCRLRRLPATYGTLAYPTNGPAGLIHLKTEDEDAC